MSDYDAFRNDAGAVWLPRDFLVVDGPDALSFLQGQLSQDVDIDNGHSTWALLLQPQGKLVAFVRVLRQQLAAFCLFLLIFPMPFSIIVYTSTGDAD